MERYSRWRDAGTGIQPFLPPVATGAAQTIQVAVYRPFAYLVGTVKAAAVAIVALLYLLLVEGVGTLLSFSPSLRHGFTSAISSVLLRVLLACMGYIWLDHDFVSTKRGVTRGKSKASDPAAFRITRHDLVVSNWTGYVDLIYLAYRYNPTFLLPIHAPPALSPSDLGTAGTTTGRQTGTGSAQITLPSISNVTQTPLLGFKPMRLHQIIGLTGQTPLNFFDAYHQQSEGGGKLYSLREARDTIYGPLVVFPEGTTSNGRALLRFSKDVLADVDVPVRRGIVWLTFFRHPPPTLFTASATHPLATNPFTHLITSLLPTLSPRTLSIRTLHPHCAPSSGDFLPSEVLGLNGGEKSSSSTSGGDVTTNVLGACCQTMMLSLSRSKQVGMGWEDKAAFLEFWRQRRQGAAATATGGKAKAKAAASVGSSASSMSMTGSTSRGVQIQKRGGRR